MLTDSICKGLKPRSKTYLKADSNGLGIEVYPNGSKYWRLRYRIAGKAKLISLGVYPKVSLKEAREKALELKELLNLDIDPSQERKQYKLKLKEHKEKHERELTELSKKLDTFKISFKDSTRHRSQKRIGAYDFWYTCLMSFYNSIYPAYYLQKLYPLDCNSIRLPVTLTNLQLFLLGLNTNPYALYALQKFTLDPEYLEPFLRAVGTQFSNLGEYVSYLSMDVLKSLKLAPFCEPVNIISILLSNPSVRALFDRINAEFPEGGSAPNKGLKFLSQLALENENLNSPTIPIFPANIVFIVISDKDIKKILPEMK